MPVRRASSLKNKVGHLGIQSNDAKYGKYLSAVEKGKVERYTY